ncbi:cation-translocating P-type ATPase [Methanocaldococcus sp. 16A]
MNGLSNLEVEERIKKYGYNELKEKKKVTWVKILLRQFSNILVWILFVAAIISFFIGEILNFWVIIFLLFFIIFLGFIQEYKAESAMEALKKIVQPTTRVIREGKIRKILSREVVPGDLLILEMGDKIPADAEVIEAINLKVDESILTGESKAIEKKNGDLIFAGTQIVHGKCKAVVVATGMNTKLGKIARMIQDIEEKTPLQEKITKLGKILALIALIACVIIFIFGVVKGIPILEILVVALALAVAAVPEGLPLALTLTLSFGMNRMAKQNAIIRKLLAVETLGSVTIICADKTGTITKNEMTVEKIFVDDKIFDVTGIGYEPKGRFFYNGIEVDINKEENLILLLKAVALCNNSVLEEKEGKWGIIGDPTEGALIVAATKADLWKEDLEKEYPRVGEIIFTSERKMMTTIHKKDGKFLIFSKGAPEIILKKCKFIKKKDKIKEFSDDEKTKILKINKDFASSAFRVLGVAYKETSKITPKNIEENLVFLGLIAMIDPPREGVKEAIEACKRGHIKVIMVTGDNEETAKAVAKKIGLFEENKKTINNKKLKKFLEKGVITGSELNRLRDEELGSIVEDIIVYARVVPEQKLRIVNALKKKGHIVAMTGDGVNDAPALKNADIGIAMGIKGTDVAREASDMILQDDNFATIVEAIKNGRAIYENIEKFTCYLISRNFTEVILIGLGIILLGFEFLPLLPLQILFINMFDEEMPAIALGLDPAREDIMNKPPREVGRGILTRRNSILVFSLALFMATVAFLIFIISNPTISIEKARTMVFVTIVGMVVFNTFNFRSLEESIFKIGIFANKLLILSATIIALTTLFVVYIPFLQEIFKFTPLNLKEWIICLVGAFSTSIFMEIIKLFMKKRS